ncbi:hypothetical protein L195_g053568 [Trifolium pratense]|uniref:Uncharacterized protein n=1 Tax=Trifolium pratense TaxID=57577 RepID=A0A2K3KB89_TRIPR|nr:hypothetical protein L195_g053568 [Trifolium pratense]
MKDEVVATLYASHPNSSLFKALRWLAMELNLGLEFGIGLMKEERPHIKRRADIAPPRKMQPFEAHMDDLFFEPNFAMAYEYVLLDYYYSLIVHKCRVL